ncbi:hypothetical protein FDP41_003235 [Naegleria fowleri]|uniref:Vacuolar protein sorting-associated protein 54 N-terminal domain-containing protein n=1 Tax=Naegleria fowleri TaxID=5763 RepID=A0A6A5BJ23_NAEFO|nr:uncharacterized protein FDP41_003235 [Naegleria fowleri]KAF0977913.1 hypothetical protein FDP41_003235 [Naegleria fowleri]
MSNRRESLRNTAQGSASSPRGSSNLSTGSSSSRYNEPETEEDILNSVSKIYFQDVQGSNEMTSPTKGVSSSAMMNNGIDLVEFVLTQPTLDLSDEASILTELNKQEKVLGVVNNRLGKTVMNNYNSFVEGMTNVQEVGADLNMTSLMCKNGRKRLKKAHENLVHGGLMIVALYRKKKSLKTLEYYLGRIKEIVDKDKEMNQLLEEGNFPSAIALMLEHRQSVVSMNQFTCVQQLDRNIKNVYQRMEQKMKESLLSVCAQFDPIAYERILIASKELSSGEISVDIKKNYNDAVEQLLREVVLSFAMQSPKAQNIESIVKMDYANLCKKIHFDHVLASLLRALSTVSDIMYNYYQMYCWHLQKEKDKDETLKAYDFSITKTNLNQFRKTLWDNIQKKISIFLSSCDLSHFKIDKFLQVFHSINMICHLGEEFSESDSYHLKGALKTKSRSYFVHYHKDILENIKTMVENENWQQLESVSFSVNDIPEFRSKSNNALDSIENIYEEYSKKVRGFLKSNDRDSNPFKLAFEKGSFLLTTTSEEEEETVDDGSSESSESSEDEDDDFIKKKDTKPKKKKEKTLRSIPIFP